MRPPHSSFSQLTSGLQGDLLPELDKGISQIIASLRWRLSKAWSGALPSEQTSFRATRSLSEELGLTEGLLLLSTTAVCPSCRTAGESGSQWWFLPDWRGWFTGSAGVLRRSGAVGRPVVTLTACFCQCARKGRRTPSGQVNKVKDGTLLRVKIKRYFRLTLLTDCLQHIEINCLFKYLLLMYLLFQSSTSSSAEVPFSASLVHEELFL